MSVFGINYDIGYNATPKTLKVTDSSTQGSYLCADERLDLVHILIATCDIRMEGTAETEYDTSRSTFWPANTPFKFRPDRRHPNLFYQRADNTAFTVTNYVTIALIVPDSIRDTVLRTYLNYVDGTFSRASTATYLTSATTVAAASTNVIRVENRGDFSLPLFEGQRTNMNTRSVPNTSTWSSSPDATMTNNYAVAPDGLTTAARLQVNYANAYGWGTPAMVLTAGYGAISAWAKSTSGSGDALRFSIGIGTDGPPDGAAVTCTDEWQWFTGSGTISNTTDGIRYNGQLNKPTTGNPALPINDTLQWGFQFEAAHFASSYIPTSGTTVIRSPDSNTFTTAQYDADMCTIGGDFYISPIYTPTQPAVGDEFWFLSFDGYGDGVLLTQTASGMRVECRVGGSVVLASNYLTWSRFGRIDVAFRPSTGSLTVSNAASGNGTTTAASFSLPNTDCRQAGEYGSTNEAYARMSNVTITV